MRFTTHVTEADFMAAYRLLCKSRHRQIASGIAYAFAAAFWSFILCAAISERTHPGELFLGRDASEFMRLLFPGAILFLLWILAFRVYPPFATRRKFRQTRTLNGEILNEVTAEGLWQKTERRLLRIFPVAGFQLLARVRADHHRHLSDQLVLLAPQI